MDNYYKERELLSVFSRLLGMIKHLFALIYKLYLFILQVIRNICTDFLITCWCLCDDEVQENNCRYEHNYNPHDPENSAASLIHVHNGIDVKVSHGHPDNGDNIGKKPANLWVLHTWVIGFRLQLFPCLCITGEVLETQHSDNQGEHEDEDDVKNEEHSQVVEHAPDHRHQVTQVVEDSQEEQAFRKG